MLISAVALTAIAFAAVVVGITAAVLELILANYINSMCASGVVLIALPISLIGFNVINLMTPLAYN